MPAKSSTIKYLTIVTLILSISYIIHGYRNALWLPRGSNDLRLRYKEQQYILKRTNPNLVYEVLRGYTGATQIEIDPAIDLSAGGGGYPPWAYFTNLFLVPVIPWSMTKIYFALLNGISLGVIAHFAFRVIRPHGRLPAIGMATSVLAMGGNSFALGTAQYGLIVNALIVAMADCNRLDRPVLGGMLYGISLVKPSISAPYLFMLGARRRWVTIGVAGLYVLIASGVIWWMTGSDPFTMLLQMLDSARAGGGTGGSTAYGPVNIALLCEIPESVAMVGTAVTGLGFCFVLTWIFRDSQAFIQLAIASTMGYFWTVHRAYDDVMLVFLLIALGELALRDRRSGSSAMFLLAAILFWAPPSVSENAYFGYFKVSVWAWGLAYLLARDRTLRPGPTGSRPTPP
ncbi:glycosyltransferase 87 family protein [Singulisphaera sp. Ch08]|uniref:Glycosyltransferase 87 family protein n=1 Tax=Singulisphaera sp. Ch08 TaxID=3120278 RepID=A0AAU7CQC8_9BACT